MVSSPTGSWPAIQWQDIAEGAQTVRRWRCRAGGGLLRGKDPRPLLFMVRNQAPGNQTRFRFLTGSVENLFLSEEHYIVHQRLEHQRAALAPVGVCVDGRVEAAFDL